MINKEINLNIAGIEVSIFMQDNFFIHKSFESPLHKHNYPEIHICVSGKSEFFTDSGTLTVDEGEMLVIPSHIYHRTQREKGVERISFQISVEINEIKILKLPKHRICDIFEEIEHLNARTECTYLSTALAGVIAPLIEAPKEKIHDITDRSFLIHEFFLYNYAKQITLCDLAKELNLSTKQASRSVKACFGTSFSEELTKRRMEAAHHLHKTTDLSLGEIASSVGYLSYSGFWKAYNLYNSKDEI